MKRKLVGIIVCMLIIVATVIPVAGTKNKNQNSNIKNIEWEATYGGDLIDWGNCIQQTADGGYIISGTYFRNAWSLWYSYFYLLKIDSYGKEEWYKIYGEYDSEHVGKSVQQTNDGGYIIAGFQGVTYKYDATVQKTDENGDILWSCIYGDHEAYDIAQSVQQTSDGGYIVTGWTNSYGAKASDVLLIKIDADGNDEWIKTIGGNEDDTGNCVKQTSDEGFIIVGETNSYGVNGDVYLIKTDAFGNEEWSKTFGGTGWDGGYSVQQTKDNGYIICGWYGKDILDNNVYLIKTDVSGNEEWSRNFGGSNHDEGYSVVQTSDGGYFVTGIYTDELNYDNDIYLIKTDSSGYEEWDEILDNEDTDDVGYSGLQTSDGAYIITGYTGNYINETLDVWVIKTGDEGHNHPPDVPHIECPLSVKAGEKCNFNVTSADPNNDNISYFIDWGDGTNTDWSDFTISGNKITFNHAWEKKGTYIIKVKAKDAFNAESKWSEIEIKTPKNKNIIHPLFLRFLEIFQNLFIILGILLNAIGGKI